MVLIRIDATKGVRENKVIYGAGLLPIPTKMAKVIKKK